MSMTIQISDREEQRLRKIALGRGVPVETVVTDMIATIPDSPMLAIDEAIFDTEYEAECGADQAPEIGLEEVRKILSKIPGSMTADFIAERDERF
ncbi:hypothetical protein BH11PLA2_BH11PLA2_18580 [soil metagenome]